MALPFPGLEGKMAGNSFGKAFRVTTWGESHGRAIGAVVDGCPPDLPLDERVIQKDLDRRRPGQSELTTAREEADRVEILSGVFEGRTSGTPISLMILNKGQQSHRYDHLRDVFRPGHAEATYFQKYGIYDHRGGGRASARETAARVAAGAVAKQVLVYEGIEVVGYTRRVGPIEAQDIDLRQIEKNPVRCPDPFRAREMKAFIQQVRGEGDSIGGIVEILARGVPAGLGEPVYDKMDADLAKAMMSINAVKGIEIGAGFACVEQKGTEHRDEITPAGFLGNQAGGVLGGISSGQDILVSIALKPTSSIRIPGQTVDIAGNPVEVVTTGRHDPCVGIRATPIAEAMLALVLMDHVLRHRAQNAGVTSPTPVIPASPR